MRETHGTPLPTILSLVLFLLMASSAIAPFECAEAGQSRGEGFITGSSLSDFDGVGHIDGMEGGQFVIDDRLRELSSEIKYYKPGPIKIPASAFSVGRPGGICGRPQWPDYLTVAFTRQVKRKMIPRSGPDE